MILSLAYLACLLDGAQNWASLSVSLNGGTPTVLTQAMNDLNSYTSFAGTAQVGRHMKTTIHVRTPL